ncbi:post-PEP-CTERM-1 domain-containing protein [Massilia sp. DWR3-1-1]|uniref:post-PEP-CTERM-1 domain-containing protein n=1 Tax=Massilia sp. DWR3-1-1 TaxID=2804559 RepID=UPI003CF518A5
MTNTLLKIAGACFIAATACAAHAQDGQMVSRDPITGQLRAPTEAERSNLEKIKKDKARSARTAPTPTEHFYHKSGATGISAPDDSISTAVAVIKNGKVEQECFDGPKAAEEAIQKGVVRPHAHTASE